MTKRILAILTVLSMLLTFLPVSADGTDTAVSIALTVENNTYLVGDPAPPWTGIGFSQNATLSGSPTLLSATVDMLSAANVSYILGDGNYMKELNGIAEKECGNRSGWMVSVNGWFPNVGADALYLRDGDVVSWQYSLDWGADLGSSWTSMDTTVSDLGISSGTLKPAFAPEVFEYVLVLSDGTDTVRFLPRATNRNNQTRIYKNVTVTDRVIDGESVYENVLSGLTADDEIPESLGYFRYGQEIAVAAGDVITVACGLPGWNGSPLPSTSNELTENGCIYTIRIERPITVSVGVYDHTAVTYNETASSVVPVSANGTVAEETAYAAHTGMTALDLFTDFFAAKNLAYSINHQYNYIESVNGLAEFSCGYESGWMFSVNDNFGNLGAGATTVNDGERFELHYSVSGYGADVGSYFGNLPTVTEFRLAGISVTLSSRTTYGGPPDYLSTTEYYLGAYVEGGMNTLLSGDGSLGNPFIIPLTVPYGTDLTQQAAEVKTSLHPYYRSFEGVDPTAVNDWSGDVTFCLKTPGDFCKTYYTLRTQVGPVPITPSGSGGSSYVKPKELPIADLAEPIKQVGAFLQTTVSVPTVSSVGGEWTVFGLARSPLGVPDAYFRTYFDELFMTLNEKNGVLHARKYTEYARAVLALCAVGRDPSQFSGYDLTAPLTNSEAVEKQGLNGVIWALLALNVCEGDETARTSYRNYLLEHQLADGGWSLSGTSADADMTAMAIVALASLGEDAVVKEALEILATLPATTAESLAWEVVALSETGVALNDRRFCVNNQTILDRMLAYQTEDGFAHVLGGETNLMATEQCFYAMVAADRAANQMPGLFDLSDHKTVTRVPQKPVLTESIGFSDLEGVTTREKVEALANRGIINGRSVAAFCPDESLTRAELATLLVGALSLTRKTVTSFSDLVAGAWYQDFVEIAVAHKIIYGTSETTFDPDSAVTREQTALMFNRAAAILELPALFTVETDPTPILRAEAAVWLYDLLTEASLL